MRRKLNASPTFEGHHNSTSSSATSAHGTPPPAHPPGSPQSRRPPSPPGTAGIRPSSARLSSSPAATLSGASPSRRRQNHHAGESDHGHGFLNAKGDSPNVTTSRGGGGGGVLGSGDRGRGSPGGGAGERDPNRRGSLLSPENPSSEMGSEYDEVDYVDEAESEGGEVDFAGVTNDIEVSAVDCFLLFFFCPFIASLVCFMCVRFGAIWFALVWIRDTDKTQRCIP